MLNTAKPLPKQINAGEIRLQYFVKYSEEARHIPISSLRAQHARHRALVVILWMVFSCQSAYAGATEIIDFGNLARISLIYVIGLMVPTASFLITERRKLVANLLMLYVLAQIVLVVMSSAVELSNSTC